MNEIGKQIREAQSEMYGKIHDALAEFTEKTGLVCAGVNWNVYRAGGIGWETTMVGYHDFRGDLESGLEG